MIYIAVCFMQVWRMVKSHNYENCSEVDHTLIIKHHPPPSEIYYDVQMIHLMKKVNVRQSSKAESAWYCTKHVHDQNVCTLGLSIFKHFNN